MGGEKKTSRFSTSFFTQLLKTRKQSLDIDLKKLAWIALLELIINVS